MSTRPALGLSVTVTDAYGASATFDADARKPQDRPSGISFGTRRGEGFSQGSCVLPRDGRFDQVDLRLLSDVVFTGADGSRAYEGRLTGLPRSFEAGGAPSVQLNFVGHAAALQDRTITDGLYVDRDLSKWTGVSVQRRLDLISSNFVATDPSVQTDTTTGQPALQAALNDTWVSTARPIAEAMYDAGASPIGSLYYAWKISSSVNSADALFSWVARLGTGDTFTSTNDSANLRAAGPGTGTLTASGASKRYAAVQFYYNGAGTTAGAEYDVFWTVLAVFGTRTLTKQGTASATAAQGYYLSDIIADLVSRHSSLSTAGIETNQTLIEQAAYDGLPYDAILDLNKYALWEFGVWENKTVHYSQADLTDYDWEIRLEDPGTSTTLQGDDANELRNGIVVVYDDIPSGRRRILTPDDYSQLQDPDPNNPATIAGLEKWGDPFVLSTPCTENMALSFGQMKLDDVNQPKEAGEIAVTGHARNRAGQWRPAHEIRAGETVAITDFANSRPRLVVETDYDDANKQMRVATDSTFRTLDAFIDRLETARQIAGLAQ
jgi:hypothetical protein